MNFTPNTRRGHTQETVNQKGHSHLFLSRMNPLYNNNLTTRGFTLIELLVVVLIIAVLAAVAIPQYNKAVKKAQGREVVLAMDILDKALHAYYLEHGTYEGANVSTLNVEMPQLKHFRYAPTGAVYSLGSHTFSDLAFQQNNEVLMDIANDKRMFVSTRWSQGKVVDKYCSSAESRDVSLTAIQISTGASGPSHDLCTEYFNCSLGWHQVGTNPPGWRCNF